MFCNLPMNEIMDGHLSWEDGGVQDHIREILDECEWFEHDGDLYIVTEDNVYGVDDDFADRLWENVECANVIGMGMHELADDLGISYIPKVLRRFDILLGFYHA